MPSKVEIFCLVSLGTAAVLTSFPSCSHSNPVAPQTDATQPMDVTPPTDVHHADTHPIDVTPPPQGSFCNLPGSVIWTAQGYGIVPGGPANVPDITWLQAPPGFCVHYFTTVPEARQVRVAPGGDVFVASPSQGCPGNQGGGLGAIVVLPDDNHDGFADSTLTFLGSLGEVQGLLFANSSFYFQNAQSFEKVPFADGDRMPSAMPAPYTTVTLPPSSDHWSKVIDVAQDGTIYVTNGSDQGEACLSTRPVIGAILRVEADGSETEMAKGFRNPIAMRCEKNHNVCLILELELDGSSNSGGREKIVPLHQGDDWGFPCCATNNTPYGGVTYQDTGKTPDCSAIPVESTSFVVGHTPFGIAYEPGAGLWPAPWGARAFVTLHGDVGSWTGARVVGIALDPSTGLPLPSSELPDSGADPNDLLTFALGWDDGSRTHGRPAAVDFGADGRLWLTDDWNGVVAWIAPVGLMQH
jgi:glucose/arabinose dehydrogenase